MKSVRSNNSIKVICIALTLFVATPAVFAQLPNNAALLYYQAFLSYEKPDDTMKKMIEDFRKGRIGANEVIAEHVEKNRSVIDYIVKATGIPHCDWGYDYSQGIDLLMPNLSHFRRVCYLIETEARLLAEQGDYRTALDRCMSIHKMALHEVMGNKTFIGYLVEISLHGRANETLKDVLAIVPEDPSILTRLKEQLVRIRDNCPSLSMYIAYEAEIWAAEMRKDRAETLARMVIGEDKDPSKDPQGAHILAADEGFFETSRNYYLNHFSTLISTLDLGLPYRETLAKLQELAEQPSKDADKNPDVGLAAACTPAIGRIYQLTVRCQTHFNAVETAIDIYIAKAKTGRLPETLPASSPLDLFSSKPFEYEKTDEVFVLRCAGSEDLDEDKIHEYEFKVPK